MDGLFLFLLLSVYSFKIWKWRLLPKRNDCENLQYICAVSCRPKYLRLQSAENFVGHRGRNLSLWCTIPLYTKMHWIEKVKFEYELDKISKNLCPLTATAPLLLVPVLRFWRNRNISLSDSHNFLSHLPLAPLRYILSTTTKNETRRNKTLTL